MDTVLFPGSKKIIEKINGHNDNSTMLSEIFESMINLTELSLTIYYGLVLRVTEDHIMDEENRKKYFDINKILTERFKAPTLGTLVEISRKVSFLLDSYNSTVPDFILQLKDYLASKIEIEELSYILNDLQEISINQFINEELKASAPRYVYSAKTKKLLLNDIFLGIIEFRNKYKHQRELSLIIKENESKVDVAKWKLSFYKFLTIVKPFLDQRFVLLTELKIEHKPESNIEDGSKNLIANYKSFRIDKHTVTEGSEQIPFDDYIEYEDYKLKEVHLLEYEKDKRIDLFPFIKLSPSGDFLFYKKTSAKGYEYYSLQENKLDVITTKRKFNHSIYPQKFGDEQALFWSEVPPVKNKKTGVRANIPIESKWKFIGRKRQIKKISEEILSIPNIDGIIYGPGGVGKTALVRAVTQNLFESEEAENPLFENIIWVSSKTNYLNPILGEEESKQAQFDSLSKIFTVILKFFEYEYVDEYDQSDKRDMVIDVLKDNKILLILDNFETISKGEAHKIINFFGTEVKRELRKVPYNFKVIITSRELIPSGFHQIQLNGLDKDDSKKLMIEIQKKYSDLTNNLNNEQLEKIHDASFGIPLIIIHCLGRVFEYRESINKIIMDLNTAGSKIVQFSFKEILNIIEKDELRARILILLDMFHVELITRQMADILEVEERDIEEKLSLLLNWQCVEVINEGSEQRYLLNSDLQLMVKQLSQDRTDLRDEINNKITKNFGVVEQMSYSLEEEKLVGVFNKYLIDREIVNAERFITNQIEENPSSIYLRYSYCKFLIDYKDDYQRALEILFKLHDELTRQQIIEPAILILIVNVLTSKVYRNYSEASSFALELEKCNCEDEKVLLTLAEFYINWSLNIKMNQKSIDPIRDIERIALYKEKANKGLTFLDKCKIDLNHKYYFTLAIGKFNTWENEKALEAIQVAIKLVENDANYKYTYSKLRGMILNQINRKNGKKRAIGFKN